MKLLKTLQVVFVAFLAAIVLVPVSVTAQESDEILSAQEVLKRAAAGTLSSPTNQFSLQPSIYVEELTAQVDANRVVQGSFKVHNASDATVGGLQYNILILGPAPTLVKNQLVSDEASIYQRQAYNQPFSLSAGASKTITLSHPTPVLPDGSYRLRVQLKSVNGRELGWADQTLKLTGATTFATVTPGTVDVSSKDPVTGITKSKWQPLEGPNVDANKPLILNARVSQNGTRPLTLTPRMTVTRLFAVGEQPKNIEAESFTVAAREQKNIALALNSESRPGSYQILLNLVDDQNQPASNLVEYRYVVRGASASIVSQTIKNLPTKAGEAAEINFSVVGAADRETTVNGTVEIQLLDGDKVVATTQSDVSFTDPNTASGTALLTLESDLCGVPTVRTIIRDTEGALIDTYDTDLSDVDREPCPGQEETTTGSSPNKDNMDKTMWLIPIAALALVLIGLIAYIMKSRRQQPPTPPASGTITPPGGLALLLAAGVGVALVIYGLMGSAPAQANGIQWIEGGQNQLPIDLWINQPQHNGTYNSQQAVQYDARLTWQACGNSVSEAAIYVYSLNNGSKVSNPNNQSWTLQGEHQADFARASNDNFVTHSTHFTLGLDLDAITAPNTTVWTYASAQRGTQPDIIAKTTTVIQDLSWVNLSNVTPTPSPSVSPSPSPTSTPECSDGLDNDADGANDCADPGCWQNQSDSSTCNPNDDDERHTPDFDPGDFEEND